MFSMWVCRQHRHRWLPRAEIRPSRFTRTASRVQAAVLRVLHWNVARRVRKEECETSGLRTGSEDEGVHHAEGRLEVMSPSWPGDIPLDRLVAFGLFSQRQANRIIMGEHRHGPPKRKKRYLDRLKKELKAYERTGNMEHLLNIANYCFLESEKPQHKKFHFNATVDSETRKEFDSVD